MADCVSTPIPFTVRRAAVCDEHSWEQFTWHWGSFLQSWRWGELRRESGWQPIRFLAEHEGDIVGLIQGLYRRLYGSLAFVYVPRGPTTRDDAAQIPLLEAVLREARHLGAWFVRIEPELPQSSPLGIQLATSGWRSVPFHVQLPHTVRVDLKPDEATLLTSFRQTWRRFIRQATVRGVTIREGTAADLLRFYALERETAERQHILGRSFAYYERFWRYFAGHGARLWLAESEGLLLGALFVLEWGTTATYVYGASTRQLAEKRASYALQWAAMCHAKARGCTTYDLWGTGAPDSTADPLAGLTYFKSGFGPVTTWLGTWDKPLHPGYRLWIYGEQLRRRWLQRKLRRDRRKWMRVAVGDNIALEDVTDISAEQWDRWLAASPGGGHWMQSHAWGEYKRRRGWRPLRVILREGQRVIATAQIGIYTLPLVGSLAYCAKGPWLDWNNAAHVEAFFTGVRRRLRHERVFALQVEPEALECNERLKKQFTTLGLQRYWTNHQFKTTMIVDLTLSEEEILRRMSQTARRFIRAAARDGVVVHEETSRATQEEFYQLFRQTSARDGFFLRPRAYLLSYWQHLIDAGMGRFLVARKEGQPLAGMFLTDFAGKIWYKDGVSTPEGQKLHAPYAVQWAAIQWGKRHGATSYDMVAIPDPDQLENRDHPLWGLYDFKRKFGGEVREFIRAYQHPYRSWRARLWVRLEPLYYRAYMRLRHDVYY